MKKSVPGCGVQSRSETTEAAYLKGGQLLLARAMRTAPNAVDMVEALQIMFSNPELKLSPSTTRTYRQQVNAVLSHQAAIGAISPARAAAGSARVAELLLAKRGRPPKRTSAKKLKTPAFTEYVALIKDFSRKKRGPKKLDLPDQAIALMLGVAPYVGLRPVEWLTASVDGCKLIVINAKATNGRAPGPTRSIDLSKMPPVVIPAAERLIVAMTELSPAGSTWRRTLGVLDERLARACKRLKINRWSLSIFRHIAQANWKRAGFSEAEIAALAGHISVKTSRNHYAGGRHGWSPDYAAARADPELVAVIAAHNRIVADPIGSETSKGHTMIVTDVEETDRSILPTRQG